MRKLSIIFAAGLFIAQFLVAADSVRIATYNVRNYLIMDRWIAGGWRPEYPKPENEKVGIRSTILQAQPDILILQEMGPMPFLKELQADLSREGLNYPHLYLMEGADPVRHVAVLSKLEPKSVLPHKDLEFKYFDTRERVKRGMLELSFALDESRVFTLFAIHLKSRYTNNAKDPRSQIRRTKEAEACRDRIIERCLQENIPYYIIGGDFNDHPESSTMRRFYRRGDLEIGKLLPIKDDDGALWTYFYKKENSYARVDGFVLSPGLFDLNRNIQGTIYDHADSLAGSDHRMVFFDLPLAFDQTY